jgi:hypothetical protein
LGEAARARSPSRQEHEQRVLLVSGVGVVATVALFFAMGGLDVRSRPSELVAFTVGISLAFALALTQLTARSRWKIAAPSMLGPPRQLLIALGMVTAPALAVVAFAAAALWPEQAAEEVRIQTHLACGAMTLAQGALPLVVFLVLRRGTDPVHPVLTGAALGLASGAWAAALAYLRCPHVAAVHCVGAHVVPTVLFIAVGAVLGRWLLRIPPSGTPKRGRT